MPSTPRLSEYARRFVYPPGITRTVWPRVEAKGIELGLGFDWWQSQAGTVCLGYGEDGKYVATIGGIGMSIPRQVGKTYFVLAMLVILCILFPGLQVVWTAHHLRTSTKTFTTLRAICRRRKVAPYIKPGGIRAANGEQQVAFTNGSLIMFGARSMGFGRGFDEIDVEVFDEAQILDTKALEDMIAATNQARHEHGALLFFMGTPPRPTDPSGAFTQRRADAWAGEAEDSIWLEIGADPASILDDRTQWPLMNPSYPTRTPLESMLRLRKNLGDEDSWNREGRGVWDADGRRSIFGSKWLDCFTPDAPPAVGAIGVAVSVDRLLASIGTAGLRSDGRPHVGSTERRPGTSWAVTEAVRIQLEHNCLIVIDEKGPAGDLIDPIEDLGGTVVRASLNDYLTACSTMFDRVQAGGLTHGATDELDADVRAASWRYVSDRRAFARKGGDVSMLEAVALAMWAVTVRADDLSPVNNVW